LLRPRSAARVLARIHQHGTRRHSAGWFMALQATTRPGEYTVPRSALHATPHPSLMRRSPSQRAGARRILWRALSAVAHRHDQNTHKNNRLPHPRRRLARLRHSPAFSRCPAQPTSAGPYRALRPCRCPTRRNTGGPASTKTYAAGTFPHPPAAPFPRAPYPCDPPRYCIHRGKGLAARYRAVGGCGGRSHHGRPPFGDCALGGGDYATFRFAPMRLSPPSPWGAGALPGRRPEAPARAMACPGRQGASPPDPLTFARAFPPPAQSRRHLCA